MTFVAKARITSSVLWDGLLLRANDLSVQFRTFGEGCPKRFMPKVIACLVTY